MAPTQDYRKYYDLERYLLEDVGQWFRDSGRLRPLDLFLILHWKSPRAKTKALDRLKARCGTFERATTRIARSLREASDNKERLTLLMRDWGFRFPTATALLTILYPEDFTIYDVRVRSGISFSKIRESYSERTWESVWGSYVAYKKRVIKRTPRGFSPRDKDRYLWGRSLFQDARCTLEQRSKRRKRESD
jgi:hypothetical protein